MALLTGFFAAHRCRLCLRSGTPAPSELCVYLDGKGMALAAQDRHKDAITSFTKAIALDKKDERAYYQADFPSGH